MSFYLLSPSPSLSLTKCLYLHLHLPQCLHLALCLCVCVCVYSAYGDSVFLGVQLLVLCYLCLHYAGRQRTAFILGALYAVGLGVLISPATPINVLGAMQASVLPIVVIAKVCSTAVPSSPRHLACFLTES